MSPQTREAGGRVLIDARTSPVTVTTLDLDVELVAGLVPAARSVAVVDQADEDAADEVAVGVPVRLLAGPVTEPTRAASRRAVVAVAAVPAGLGVLFGVGLWLGNAGVGVALLTHAAGVAAGLLLLAALAATGRTGGAHCPECPGVDR